MSSRLATLTLIGSAVVCAEFIAPSAAFATTTITPLPLPLPLPGYLWVTAAAGGIGAVLLISATALYVRHSIRHSVSTFHLRNKIRNASAWDFKDSWVTNLTTLGAILSGIFTQTAISSFLKGVDPNGFTVMSMLFGGIAVMAPVVYGAFLSAEPNKADTLIVAENGLSARTEGAPHNTPGSHEAGTDATPVGTLAGLLAAALVASFATFGLLANVGLLVSNSIATGPDKFLIVIGLGAAALAVSSYILRATKFMAMYPDSKDGVTGGEGRRSGTP